MLAYVIKPEEVLALNYLADGHPRPQRIEWINRGTDKPLKPSSVEVLLRTLFVDVASPSVVNLHRSAGLRAIFRSDKDREKFATEFASACARKVDSEQHVVTAIFNDRKYAEQAVLELIGAGIPEGAISLLWRVNQFVDAKYRWPEGHSKLSIVGATLGGGAAGAALGMAVLAIPGVGPVAAAGAVVTSAFSSVAAVSGIIGATGGAIGRMLSDCDVDNVAATYFEKQIQSGRIFVSVDTRHTTEDAQDVFRILKSLSGRISGRTRQFCMSGSQDIPARVH